MTIRSFSSATDQIRAVQQSQVTVEHIVSELFEQIQNLDQDIHAWAHIDQPLIMAHAQALDRGPDRPLRGLVFAAKDNIDTSDMPTSYGSPIHIGATPARDAACIAQLRLQGALLLGKTISTEFAHVYPGATCNPHNPKHTPGGSSSGSAAAVASHMVPVALGTQTTGSVIRPAAFCGVVGFKPSHGDINTSGVLANAPSFDTVGVLAQSVSDTALVHASLLHSSDAELIAREISGLRVGICRTPWWERADSEAQSSLEHAARALENNGASVSDFDDLGALRDLDNISARVSGFEFAQTMSHERLYAMDQLSSDLRDGRMRTGFDTSHAQYIADKQQLEQARLLMDKAFDACDVVISLPACGAAPHGLRRTGDAILNMPWTTLHTRQ